MVLVVGDRIDFTYYHYRLNKWASIQGHIVKIIHKGEIPSQAEMEVFYKLKPGDKYYAANCQSVPFDRLVIVKENGGFFIIPMTPQCVYNRLFKILLKEDGYERC